MDTGYTLRGFPLTIVSFSVLVTGLSAGLGSLIVARFLAAREREVLAVMTEGRSNTNIARTLVVSDGAVDKHIRNIFAKLMLPPDEGQHRRVLAVLSYRRA